MARRNLVAELMEEPVIYGGCIATRYEVYRDILEMGHTRAHADRMCMTLARATPEQVAERPRLLEVLKRIAKKV